MATYTEPRVWIAGEPASAVELNKVMENIRALKTPPSGIATIRNGANITTTNTAFVAIDTSQLSVNLTTTGGMLMLSFDGDISHSVANTAVPVDVYISDLGIFASTLTATAQTNGLWTFRPSTAAVAYHMSGEFKIPAGALAAGNHTFQVYWRVFAAGTGTLQLLSNTCQFSVYE